MTAPHQITAAINRLVKTKNTQPSMRDTLEAHADSICSEHNRMLSEMLHYLATGEARTNQLDKEWLGLTKENRGNPEFSATMRAVLEGSMIVPPSFQGTSDAQALELYNRMLLNLYNVSVIGQPPVA